MGSERFAAAGPDQLTIIESTMNPLMYSIKGCLRNSRDHLNKTKNKADIELDPARWQ